MTLDLQEATGWTETRPADVSGVAQSAVAVVALIGSVFGAGTAAPMTNPRTACALVVDWTQQSLAKRSSSKQMTSTSTGTSPSTKIQTVSQAASSPASTAAAVRALHSRSGLTWEQLARLFGVSRRTVHNWATGARVNAANAELLARVAALLETRKDFTSTENRDWLLMSRAGGRSLFDELRLMSQNRAPVEDVIGLRERLGLA